MARSPFEYITGCSGPSVDLDIVPIEFPLCSPTEFTDPTFCPNLMDFTVPDVAPPPFCPCIPTIEATTEALIAMTNIDADDVTMDIKIVPITQDCCDPEFKISFDIDIPCIPFSIILDPSNIRADIVPGEADALTLAVGASVTNCQVDFSVDLDIPCLPFDIVINPSINRGTIIVDVVKDPDNCQFDIDVVDSIYGVDKDKDFCVVYPPDPPDPPYPPWIPPTDQEPAHLGFFYFVSESDLLYITGETGAADGVPTVPGIGNPLVFDGPGIESLQQMIDGLPPRDAQAIRLNLRAT